MRGYGDACFDRANYATAGAIFQRLLNENYEPVWCQFQLGRVAARFGRWPEAIERFDQALSLGEPVAWIYYERSQALKQIGAPVEAVCAELLRFVKGLPDGLNDEHYTTLDQAAHAAFDSGRYDEAESLYESIQERSEGGYIRLLRLADLRLKRNSPSQALSLLSALERHPDYNHWADYLRGLALAALGEQRAAVESLERALIAAPENVAFWERLLIELDVISAVAEIGRHDSLLEQLTGGEQAKIAVLAKLLSRDLNGLAQPYAALSDADRRSLEDRIVALVHKLALDGDATSIGLLLDETGAVARDASKVVCAAMVSYCHLKDWDAARSLMLQADRGLSDPAEPEFLACKLQLLCYTLRYDDALLILDHWPGDLGSAPDSAVGLITGLYATLGRWDDVLRFFLSRVESGAPCNDELFLEAVARATRRTGRQEEISEVLNAKVTEASDLAMINLRDQLIEETVWLRALTGEPSAVSDDALEVVNSFRQRRARLVNKALSGSEPTLGPRTIFFCTDLNYLTGCSVALYSLLRNNVGKTGGIDFRVYVSDDGLALAGSVFEAVAKAFAVRISVLSAESLLSDQQGFRTGWGLFTPGHGLSRAAYYRIYAARQLIYEGIGGRALYIDADTLVGRGIEALLDFELEGRPLAARRELAIPEILQAADKLEVERDAYFNSGVMLFDLSHAELSKALNDAIDFSLREPEKLTFVDQCALNWAFRGLTSYLPDHCNYYIRQSTRLPIFVESPIVSHFLDRPKPWDPMYRNHNCVPWLREFSGLADVIAPELTGQLVSVVLSASRPQVQSGV